MAALLASSVSIIHEVFGFTDNVPAHRATTKIKTKERLSVCICGGGNGAHILAGLAASRPGVESRVLTLYADEAERWTKAMESGTFKIEIKGGGMSGEDVEVNVEPFRVSKDPQYVVPGAQIIILCVPAFAHKQYFDAMAPYVGEQSTIIGLPGANGFEFQLRGILKERSDLCTVMVFESLPWACRIKKFGTSVELLATKAVMDGAIHRPRKPSAFHHNHLASFQYMLGDHPQLKIKGHLLGITLTAPNSVLHPIIMYGQWVNWDGKPQNKAPLFYTGVTLETGDLMGSVSDEVLAVAKSIMDQVPGVNLNNVKHIYDWLNVTYDEIGDRSTLTTCLRTNKGYQGLTHPCIKTDDGQFLPNFKFRYMTEDITFGLAVIKGIADIACVPTPSLDKVVYWAQKTLGKEFLVDGKLTGKDVKETRAPQAYGLVTLEAILKEDVDITDPGGRRVSQVIHHPVKF
ncbi:tauropine dehydrogenase-like [Lineus longissimus]|uniref:tauropine dehydrogenase-like n=1 Tax=Lineus longissimus TaxID=88925 RepID=UPI002B4FA16E